MRTWTLLRRAGVIVGLTMAFAGAAPVATSAKAPPDPFLGSYRGIDSAFDDSNMILVFGGPDAPKGPRDVRRVVLLDDLEIFACGGDDFFAEGIGFVDGNTILVIFETYCGNAGNLLGMDEVTFVYDSSTGRLTDSYTNEWWRP